MPLRDKTKKLSWDGKVVDPTPSIAFQQLQKTKSIRQEVTFSERKFDVKTLAPDLHRVYKNLERDFGEEYALTFVFIFRTGVELHRAWHMTLLTSKILQQIKDKFNMRMTWELGVIKLKFRVEDGGYELHRKVPYDYDSEYQDMYMKIAVALVDGNINVHQGLILQSETKKGEHTAKSGLFLRDFPGRLVLYPLEAATCAVIFFSGDWFDAGVAAVTGLVAGIIEYILTTIGGSAKNLVDISVGTSTGMVAGLFYRFVGQKVCLPSVFLGTLYWYFYGTAFVLGILEIVSGELETGVVRFMAVAVKTFVLSLGTTFGMQMVLTNSVEAYQDQEGNCGNIDLDEHWWRIPLYLLCSASALGQYRMPINVYWRALAVQLVGYEVQYQIFLELAKRHDKDLLDTAAANVCGAIAAVVFAAFLSAIVDRLSYYYNARVLQREKGKFSVFGEFMYSITVFYIRFSNWLGFGKKNDVTFYRMAQKLKKQSEELNDAGHSRQEITLTANEEKVLLGAVVDAEPLNIWALLMPTVYQLVPGSLIAKLWFNAIFPPPLESKIEEIEGSEFDLVLKDQVNNAVFSNLMVVATSLAIGLMFGFAVVELFSFIWSKLVCKDMSNFSESMRFRIDNKKDRLNMNYVNAEDDPESDNEANIRENIVADEEVALGTPEKDNETMNNEDSALLGATSIMSGGVEGDDNDATGNDGNIKFPLN